jgi:hypothetical protein
MPGFDGTGPRGEGPMTGRGEGYCAVVLPERGRAPYGYAGLQGMPVRPEMVAARPGLGARLARWLRPYPAPVRGYRWPLGLGRPRWGMRRGFWGRGRRGGGRDWGRRWW